ncbi:lycopene cyclase domain-containing protein [Microbacterium aurum]
MTYALIIVPFALLAAIVVAAAAVRVRRPRVGRRLAASAVTAVILVLLTIVFDNLMIAAGLFTYPEHLISGIRVGLAPVEDLAYPVVAAFLLPAIADLLRPRTGRPSRPASSSPKESAS